MEIQSGEEGIESLTEDALPGVDHAMFHKAGRIAWKIFQKDDEHLIESFYLLMSGINNGILQGVNIPEIIRRNPKEGIELSDRTVKNYWLQVLQTEDETSGCDIIWGRKLVGDILYRINLDAPVGAMLMYKDKPHAILGLSLSDPYTLKINQLQGVTAHRAYDPEELVFPGGLMQLDWTKVLVDCAEEIAGNLGLENISIIRAANVTWTDARGKEQGLHLPADRATTIYDYTAVRCGFKPTMEDGNWYKELK
jgi:hypothetical protein